MGRVNRFDVYLSVLDPTVGREMQKTRPCVVLSPQIMNDKLGTYICAPMTSKPKKFPYRVQARFKNVDGEICLDQMRVLDKTRLVKKLGTIDDKTQSAVIFTLHEMFA